jgi:hypothetical protein
MTDQKPLILLGLNELNFDYARWYAERGHLPTFDALFNQYGIVCTSSEKTYHELEPWIQWVSIQTGKNFSEHGIFRLGDVAGANITQIWEHVETAHGVKIAAISPMNAANNAKNPAFFIPDPWTKTKTTGNWLMKGLAGAVSNAVNENATGGGRLSTYFFVLLGFIRYSFFKRPVAATLQLLRALKTHYQRAVLLDQLLVDMFETEWKKANPGFSSLFLNGGAHVQHHYLFNAAPYDGPNKNPDWYMPQGRDPVLDIYKAYDALIAQLLRLPSAPRLVIATGLHQTPVDEPVYYWRLKDHADFLNRIGVRFESVETRMSRDFLISFADKEACTLAQKKLAACKDRAGRNIFGELDHRGKSLFASLTYPDAIGADFTLVHEAGILRGFDEMVAFVALKNGEHDGEGYLVDTGGVVKPGAPYPITDIFGLIDAHFSRAQSTPQSKAA